MRRAAPLAIVLYLLLYGLLALSTPASACGCGMLIAPADMSVTATQKLATSDEAGVVAWKNGHETLAMRFTISPDYQNTASQGAWVIPVPAKATVSLGSADLIADIDNAVAARVLTHYAFAWRSPDPYGDDDGIGAAATLTTGDNAPAPVEVISQRTFQTRLGALDATVLSATDPTALSDWLNARGYQLSTAFSEALAPYVADRYYYVAARLHSASGAPLAGQLPPLELRFDSPRIFYPLGLQSLSEDAEQLSVSVIAPYRVDGAGATFWRSDAGADNTPSGAYPVLFAGRLSGADVDGRFDALIGDHSELGEMLGAGAFLTVYEGEVPAYPNTGDLIFGRDSDQSSFRRVQYRSVEVYFGQALPYLALSSVILGALGLALYLTPLRRLGLARTGRQGTPRRRKATVALILSLAVLAPGVLWLLLVDPVAGMVLGAGALGALFALAPELCESRAARGGELSAYERRTLRIKSAVAAVSATVLLDVYLRTVFAVSHLSLQACVITGTVALAILCLFAPELWSYRHLEASERAARRRRFATAALIVSLSLAVLLAVAVLGLHAPFNPSIPSAWSPPAFGGGGFQ